LRTAASVASCVVPALTLNPLDASDLIQAFGAAGVIAIVFAETGLLIGFFLPGDSLLFSAGVFCATRSDATVHLELGVILPGVVIAAILGAQVGYLIGRRAGPVLFDRPRSRLFNPSNVRKAEEYFDRFGPGKAVVLARFIPIVRTFLNPVAGAVRMPARAFTLWNVVGGVLWAGGVTLLGFGIGDAVPIDRYLLPAVAVIVALSLLPVLTEVRRHRRRV
jgi:membrane-associated protein